ncbi:hypothetical protein Hypma_012104 [Hypsizygus marmoreus]|uniref:Uncharacterized protein n=1 Tax=Hypsizygus marmoreus TaxID=39966 RepID=A0A369JJD1_HYPMA|nr:hypothetical protein Hypma_012104 [Hypsizygus marmoreus]
MALTSQTLSEILSHIAHSGTTITEIMLLLMSNSRSGHPDIVHEVSCQTRDLLDALHAHPSTHSITSAWAQVAMKNTYNTEILSLTRPDSGLHYIALGITEDKICEFDIDDITERMSTGAPHLWELLDELLSADPCLRYKHDWARK